MQPICGNKKIWKKFWKSDRKCVARYKKKLNGLTPAVVTERIIDTAQKTRDKQYHILPSFLCRQLCESKNNTKDLAFFSLKKKNWIEKNILFIPSAHGEIQSGIVLDQTKFGL